MSTDQIVTLIIAGVAAVFAGAAAVAALVQAQHAVQARKDAQEARDEAAASAASATEALQRQADAAERSLALREEETRPKVKIQVRNTTKSLWEARNVGEIVAYSLQVAPASEELAGYIRPDEDGPVDAGPGDGVEFLVVRAMGMPTPRIEVTYEERYDDGTSKKFRSVLLIPS